MTTSNATTAAHGLRLDLTAHPGVGVLDGAWWPYSRDLETELADLVDHFPHEAGYVSRAVFSRPDWRTQPRKIKVARGSLKTGSFPRDDTHVLLLRLATGQQLRVLVVPPETPASPARHLMSLATAPTNRRSGADLLAASIAAGVHEPDPADRWTDDGGSSDAATSRTPPSPPTV
jgi:hypothetical protein